MVRASRLEMAAWLVLSALGAAGCQSATCAEGLSNAKGQCLSSCRVTCGEHEICDFTIDPDSCFCAPGYAGDPCTFTNAVIADPSFQREVDSGDDAWQDEFDIGARILPLSPGSELGDVGVGELGSTVLCAAGTLAKVIEMPSYADAEPLVVDVVYQADRVYGVAIGFDDAWTRLPPTEGQWREMTFCLGEAAYTGGPVTVRIGASERLANCAASATGEILIDRLQVRQPRNVEEEQCPTPGLALNALADPARGGWSFALEGDAAGALESDVGREGSAGARLRLAEGETGRASMTAKVSIPVPEPGAPPAIAFWWNGSRDALFSVTAGTFGRLDDPGRLVGTLLGSGAGENELYCLPPWTHGSVIDLSFSLEGNAAEQPLALTVDEIIVTSDPACGSATELMDPGFESAPIQWFGTSVGSLDEDVVMQAETGLARTGTGVLELTYWTDRASATFEQYVRVPAPDGARGPALRFQSKLPDDPSTTVRWSIGRPGTTNATQAIGLGVSRRLDPGGWNSNEVCLPSRWAGRWFRFRAEVEPSPDELGDIPQERVFLDDFSLGTSGRCPVSP